jgi:hypothetical protein
MLQNAKRRPLVTDGALKTAQLCGSSGQNNRKNVGLQIVRAEIIHSGQCSAENITARGPAPILKLCRLLIKAGFDPGRPLHAYRGDVLSLRVRSIGEGAGLTVKERPFGPTFERWVPYSTPPVSPAMRQHELWGPP